MRASDGLTRRIVCLYSCGAASAVATHLAIVVNKGAVPLVVHNTYLKQEHPDNQRFKAECETWFGVEIETAEHIKYRGDIYAVYRKEKFIKNASGAVCTRVLKRDTRNERLRYGDMLILGYTAEEQDRFDRFIDANPDLNARAPLIEFGLSKADCLAMIKRQGIELPMMYKLNYHNNNCIGCCKGGKGYWNKVRIDFPDQFEEMASMQDLLGPGSYFWPGLRPGQPRISLRLLPPDAGNYPAEPSIECGAMCEMLDPDGELINML